MTTEPVDVIGIVADSPRITARAYLLDLSYQIEKLETEVFSLQKYADRAKENLTDTEARLTLGGQLDAKNAEGRKAQLDQLTKADRLAVMIAENAVKEASIRLRRAQNDFQAWKAIARMPARGDE